jgi:hypothetical protein
MSFFSFDNKGIGYIMRKSIEIKREKKALFVAGRSYRIHINLASGQSRLYNKKGFLFEFPMNAWLEAKDGVRTFGFPLRADIDDFCLTIRDTNPPKPLCEQKYIFDFDVDSFIVRYEATVNGRSGLAPIRTEYFRGPAVGMLLNSMKEGFCVPKAPLSEEDYRNLFPSVSVDGLATPSILNISMKFHHGSFAVGLLDYSDATTFGISCPFMGLAVDAAGGNTVFHPRETYQGPRVLFTFPADGWNSIELFRRQLEKEHQLVDLPEKPAWWKRPIYCTYGDQIMELQPVLYSDLYWDASEYNEAWVKKAILNAEKQLGYKNFSVIIDAFWQKRWDTDPAGDPKRFPQMRKLIDQIHERGHKVLLWYSPHAIAPGNDLGKIARKFGVVGSYRVRNEALHPQELLLLDYSSDNAPAYLQEVSRRLFGNDADCLNADGVKLDFLFFIPPTESQAPYLNPVNGMGFKMVERYLKLFSSSARAIKQDVLLNYSSSDPRIAHLFGSNRLHDTKISLFERERRARISSLANPDLLIDSDGAVMMTDWVPHTYISAAIYSTPSLYYANLFNDGQHLPKNVMKTLGKLFSICEKRLWGRPVFVTYGCWQLYDKQNNVIGESYQGKLCWLKVSQKELNLICFEDPKVEIDLHGLKVKSILPRPNHLRVKKDKVVADWKPGKIYKIEIKQKKTEL